MPSSFLQATSMRRLQLRQNSFCYGGAIIAVIFILCGSTYGSKAWSRRLKEKKTQAQKLLHRNSSIRSSDGSRTLFVPYKSSTAKVTISSTKTSTFDAHKRLFLLLNPPLTKPGLNRAFLHYLFALLSIMIPRWNCQEVVLLLSQSGFLLFRTYLSLEVARLDGTIIRDLVSGNGKAFLLGILRWCGIGALASYTNAGIKFLQSKISIAFRTRLTRYVHDLYLNDTCYHKVSNLDGGVGGGILTPDHLICQDITVFCTSTASIFSSIGKPLVDLLVFNYQLFSSLGPLALTGLLANYVLTATILRKLSPPFEKFKEVEGRKEGSFRTLHWRLITNAEEVAFYGGANAEKTILDKSFKDLRLWMEHIYRFKIRYNIFEDFILKYSWSAFGYLMTSLPIFISSGTGKGLEIGQSMERHTRERGRMKDFITNKRLMLSLADAGGRIMYSIKDLSELAGHTSHIYTLIATLHRVYADAYFPPRGTHSEPYSLADVRGTLHKGYDGIRFESCPLIAPSPYPDRGDELINNLSFVVQPGDHLLITGPNGVGKSAIPRVVAGLWPVFRGLVSRPRSIGADGVMFLPQRPYLSVGTLRDQVIYPHGEIDMHDEKRQDHELLAILTDVHLGYLLGREGGWNGRKEWKNVLSGGEKQRMGIARLLYHKPRFAFIDEGTSAVSSDVEGSLYEKAKEKGITLITTSTRASLKKYHTFALSLDLSGSPSNYSIERIGTEQEKKGVEREIRDLRESLTKVEGWKKRKTEVEEQLAQIWVRRG